MFHQCLSCIGAAQHPHCATASWHYLNRSQTCETIRFPCTIQAGSAFSTLWRKGSYPLLFDRAPSSGGTATTAPCRLQRSTYQHQSEAGWTAWDAGSGPGGNAIWRPISRKRPTFTTSKPGCGGSNAIRCIPITE